MESDDKPHASQQFRDPIIMLSRALEELTFTELGNVPPSVPVATDPLKPLAPPAILDHSQQMRDILKYRDRLLQEGRRLPRQSPILKAPSSS